MSLKIKTSQNKRAKKFWENTARTQRKGKIYSVVSVSNHQSQSCPSIVSFLWITSYNFWKESCLNDPCGKWRKCSHFLVAGRMVCRMLVGRSLQSCVHSFLKSFLFFFVFFFLAALCSMWDLSFLTRDRTHTSPALEARNLNHWTTTEVPQVFFSVLTLLT